MTSDPDQGQQAGDLAAPEPFGYLDVGGQRVHGLACAYTRCDDAPEQLTARLVRLDDGSEFRQILVPPRSAPLRQDDLAYQRLDNEILAGLRLSRRAAGPRYPGEVSRLAGYEPDAAMPFALVEPYRGEIVDEVAGNLVQDAQQRFMVSLLTGIRWIAAAGLAHCAIGPSTVRWDGDRAQITDFSLATLIGSPQLGVRPDAGLGPGDRSRVASKGDDIVEACLLIYYVITGEELTGEDLLDDLPSLKEQLRGGFLEDPARRPTAEELLSRLGLADPAKGRLASDPLSAGRSEFRRQRERKHGISGEADPDEHGEQAGGVQAGPEPPKNGSPADQRRRRWSLSGR